MTFACLVLAPALTLGFDTPTRPFAELPHCWVEYRFSELVRLEPVQTWLKLTEAERAEVGQALALERQSEKALIALAEMPVEDDRLTAVISMGKTWQYDKLTDETTWRTLLSAERFADVERLRWQQLGAFAPLDSVLAKRIGLAAERMPAIADLMKEARQEWLREAERRRQAAVGASDFEATWQTRVERTLTAAHVDAWRKALGEPIKLKLTPPERRGNPKFAPYRPIWHRPHKYGYVYLMHPTVSAFLDLEPGRSAEVEKLLRTEASVEFAVTTAFDRLASEASIRCQLPCLVGQNMRQQKLDDALESILTPAQFERLQNVRFQGPGAPACFTSPLLQQLGVEKEKHKSAVDLMFEHVRKHRIPEDSTFEALLTPDQLHKWKKLRGATLPAKVLEVAKRIHGAGMRNPPDPFPEVVDAWKTP